MSTACIVWCLVLVIGVSCESPTPSPDQWWVESSVSEGTSPTDPESEWKATDSSEPVHYELSSKDSSDDTEWTAYSPEMYPLFRRAVADIAASEHGILIFWDTLNQLENPQEMFEQVFAAHNRLASEDVSSTTEGSQEATMYHLATTDSQGSEVVTDAYSIDDEASSVDDSSTEYHHTTASHEGEEGAIYYTTESPTLEAMLTDEALYASAVSSESLEDSTGEDKDVYVTSEDAYETSEDVYETSEDVYETSSQGDVVENESSEDVYEATSQGEATEAEVSSVDEPESADAASESEWENIIRRSGVLAEEEFVPDDAHCEGCPLQVGSIRGIPGVHFPNYDDIPITSFSCADKRVPGFYADLETGCQVFHVCWPHRRESFLCPIGTLFSQAILACDYWYSTNCSLSSLYFDVTTLSPKSTTPAYEKPTPSKLPETTNTPSHHTSEASTTETYVTDSYIVEEHTEVPDERPLVDEDWFRVSKFLPVKSKVTVYSKHSSKKPGSKWVVKQKHDVMPLVEEFLALTKNVAQKAIHLVPKVRVELVKPAISKPKLVKVKPAAKLEPCLKVKDLKNKPTPVVVKKPQPVPKIDPRFIVKPVVGKKPPVIVYVKKNKFVLPKVPVKQVKPLGFKTSKHHAPQIVMKALEVVGNVLQRDILDLTRQALVDSHVSSLKTKH